MPQAVDLSILDGQATPVAQTFSLICPASSDGSPAIWWNRLAGNNNEGTFPQVTMSARKNASKNARKLDITVKVPYGIVDSQLNLVRPGSAMVLNATITVPADFPESGKSNAVAYMANLFANASVIRACMRDGISAT